MSSSLLLLVLGSAWASAATVEAEWDLSASDGAFVASGTKLSWEHGEVESGPGAGTAGSRAWATLLDGNYLQDSDDRLTLASQPLAGTTRPVLELVHWYDIDPLGDLASVEAWTGGSWEPLEPVYGYPEDGGYKGLSDGWTSAWFDLQGQSDTSELRLRFTSDGTVTRAGWYLGEVRLWDGDPVPPDISAVSELDGTESLAGPYGVEATIVDDLVTEVDATLVWSVDGGVADSVPMEAQGSGLYLGELPGTAQPAEDVSWWIEASDGNQTSTAGPWSFRVALPPPLDLRGPEGRVAGTHTELSWDPPASSHPVGGYLVYRDDTLVAEVEELQATVPLAGPVDSFEVSALFTTVSGTFEGDRSEPLELAVSVPTLDPLVPDEAWQGATVRVELTGEGLVLAEGEVELDLGPGITVVDLRVVSSNRARVLLQLEEDATLGARDLSIRSGDTLLEAEAVFTVLDGASRPGIASVSPEVVEQGESRVLELSLDAEPAADPQIDLGEGVLVGLTTIEGTLLSVEITVERSAPLGTRAITIDDGTLVFEGASLRVRQESVSAQPLCGCATGSGPRGLLWLLPVLGLLGLRRR